MDRNSKLLGHVQRNLALVKVFSEKQFDLNEPRSVELHFWSWNHPNSVRLAHELYKKGFMLLLLKPAFLEQDPDRWNIEAGTRASIYKVVSEEFTASLVDLAQSLQSDYDGWGTSV